MSAERNEFLTEEEERNFAFMMIEEMQKLRKEQEEDLAWSERYAVSPSPYEYE